MRKPNLSFENRRKAMNKYGSEWHLLRWLGRHRHELHRQIEKSVGGRMIDWIDSDFHRGKQDAEWKGVDFLPDYLPAKKKWNEFWPPTGNVQNWDAVGWIDMRSHAELLLVEAKGNLQELKSICGAQEHGGRPLIRNSLDETKAAMGIEIESDWLSPYYQYCNRLAMMHFLTTHNIPCHLLFVYFHGDMTPNCTCPKNEGEWLNSLETMYKHIGLKGTSNYESRIHRIFLPVIR